MTALSSILSPFLATFLVLLPLYSAISRPAAVSDPSVCIYNSECPSGKYCDTDRAAASFTCRPYARFNETCYDPDGFKLVPGVCAPWLYCKENDFSNALSVCERKVSLGGECNYRNPSMCAGHPDVTCSEGSGKCVRDRSGQLRSSCFNEEGCRRDLGLYCRNFARCASKRRAGRPCDPFEDGQCNDLCIAEPTDDFPDKGTCVAVARTGEKCMEDAHCRETGVRANDDMVCNIPKGAIGKCFARANLLKVVGVKCNPAADRCDAKRGLSCRWAGKALRFVCMHQSSDKDVGVGGFRHCDPESNSDSNSDSALSQCLPHSGIPTECRPDYTVDTDLTISENSFYAFPKCLREVEVVGRRALCGGRPPYGGEHVRCAEGLYCRDSPLVPFSRIVFDQPYYCMQYAAEGESCKDKYGTLCDIGTTCVNKTCVDWTTASASPTSTFGSYGHFCDKSRPCGRGLVCTKNNCEIPRKIVKAGKPCFDLGYVKRFCEEDLVCNVGFDGKGVQLCRERFGVDGACEFEYQCKAGLKCSSETRKCFDPTKQLGFGERCNPTAGPSGMRCRPGNSCLPKSDGQSYCQYADNLFEPCDEKLNFGCIAGTTCGPNKYCV